MFYSLGRAIAALEGRDLVEEVDQIAARINASLVPGSPSSIEGLEVGLRVAPARVVGGDYLDVVTSPEALPLFAIGDASGKSLPAALKAVILKYIVRSLAGMLAHDLPQLLRRANDIVCVDIEPDAYISVVLSTVSRDRRSLFLANAGHVPPLIHRLATGEIDQPLPAGIVLGVAPDYRFFQQTVSLAKGDTVVFYTDGFTDARNPQGEQFTLAHVKDGLKRHHALASQPLADTLVQEVEAYSAGTLRDDASILVVRVTR
jgi:sigma-B regulation protein RsbU (phosphoserine phosphatase)